VITTTHHIAASVLANPPQACRPLEGALRIPVALIAACPLNPRKRWKPAKVAEMAQDLKANQQIHPIRVRPNPQHTPTNGRPPYEIVVGETRWRAAPEAGLVYLDAIVADCTDQQLIEMALAENTKRQDLHPLEEADGFDALLRKPDGLQGYASVPELATAVGASPSYVYQRLKLRALCAAGREAFLAGTIDASVALLIARMPSAEQQAEATARILQGFGGEAYSFRAAAEYLKQNFMLSLGRARFDITADYKVAPACGTCTKRSGAAPDLFADVTGGDMCQDARCYQAKGAEAHTQLLDTARAEGHQVLQGAQARAVLPMPSGTPASGYLRMTEPCPELTDSRRTLAELLPSATIVLVEHPQAEGTVVQLITTAAAKKGLKARGLLREQTQGSPPKKAAPTGTATAGPDKGSAPSGAADPSPRSGAGGAGAQEEAKKPKPLTEAQKRKAEEDRLRALHWLTLERFAQLLLVNISDRLRTVPELPLLVLRLTCSWLAADLTAEAYTAVHRVMGWQAPEGKRWGAQDEAMNARISTLDGRALGELLAVLLCAEDCTDTRTIDELLARNSHATQLANALRVDLTAVMREAKAGAEREQQGEAEPKSVAGPTGQALDPTTAFIQQHGTAHGGAATTEADNGHHNDQTDEGASDADD